jgi:hypothetical protein
MSIETTDSDFRRFVLAEPLENRSYSPRARSGLAAIRVFEAGTVVDVSCREIETGYETFTTTSYFINGEAAPCELAVDLRDLDPEASDE